jgi:hypothetical protein
MRPGVLRGPGPLFTSIHQPRGETVRKGCEQRSDRGFGWYTKGQMDRIVPLWRLAGLRCKGRPRLFGQSPCELLRTPLPRTRVNSHYDPRSAEPRILLDASSVCIEHGTLRGEWRVLGRPARLAAATVEVVQALLVVRQRPRSRRRIGGVRRAESVVHLVGVDP